MELNSFNMEATKIKITPIELKNQKPTEVGECFVELSDDRFVYKMDFIADEWVDNDDHSLGNEIVKNKFTATIRKEFIVGVEVGYSYSKVWFVLIVVNGYSQDVKIYFRTEGVAQDLSNKILEWLFKN